MWRRSEKLRGGMFGPFGAGAMLSFSTMKCQSVAAKAWSRSCGFRVTIAADAWRMFRIALSEMIAGEASK